MPAQVTPHDDGSLCGRQALIPTALVLSGFAALSVEVLWQRLLSQALGSTTLALTAVLAAYMGGLALGAQLAARRGDRFPPSRSLSWYVRLELIVFVAAVLITLVLCTAPDWIGGLLLTLPQGPVRFLARFLLATLFLLVPTVAMGATLPFAVRARVGESAGGLLGGVGILYAANTLGAMLGALATPLFLLPALGLRTSALMGACGSLLAAGVASLARSGARTPLRAPPPPDGPREAAFPFVAFAALATGGASLGLEILWTRALTTLAGSNAYAFAFVLALVLGGIALGSALVGFLGGRVTRPAMACGVVALVGAAAAVLLLPLLDLLPGHLAATAAARRLSLGTALWTIFGTGALVILPPAICFGAALPLAVRAGRAGGNAHAVGRVYVANTLGALAGAVATGLVLLPSVGWVHAAVLLGLLAAAGGAALLIRAAPARARTRMLAAGLALAAVAAILFSPSASPYAGAGAAHVPGRHVPHRLYFDEGPEASVLVEAVGPSRVFYVAGRPEASSSWIDLRNQYLLGHLPALLAGGARRSLVIGLGSGMTAGVLTHHGAVVVAELNRAVVPATRLFADLNHHVLDRASLRIEDGRVILAGPETFDVVTTDPIHPYVAGSASLYTVEHLLRCRSRLRPGGAVSLWVPLGQMGPRELRAIVGSFVDVFADAQLYLSHNNAILIGGGARGPGPAAALSALGRGWSPEVAADMRRARIGSPEELLAERVAGPRQLRRLSRGVRRVLADDPWIELSLASFIYRPTATRNVFDLMALRTPAERALPINRALDAVQRSYHLAAAGRLSRALVELEGTLSGGRSLLLEHAMQLRNLSARRAVQLLGAGKTREAVALARSEAEHPDATIESLMVSGTVLRATGDRAALRSRNRRLIEGWPTRPEGYLETGRELLGGGQPRSALAPLLRAIELDRFEGYAWRTYGLLGRAYLAAGDGAGGRRALRRSLALHPAQPEIEKLLR
jgi:spermidine synthase